MWRIELDCGIPLTALLTRQACEELARQENDRVLAMIKTTKRALDPTLYLGAPAVLCLSQTDCFDVRRTRK